MPEADSCGKSRLGGGLLPLACVGQCSLTRVAGPRPSVGERGRCRGWLARRGCPQTSRSPTWGTRTRAPQPVLGGTGGVSLRGTLRHGTAVTQPRKWEPGASGAEAAPQAPAGARARLPGHNRSWEALPGVFSYRQHHGPKSPPFRSTFWREF